MIRQLPPDEAFNRYSDFYLLLQKAVDRSYGEETPQTIFMSIIEGLQQLWIAEVKGKIEAAVVTQIINYPTALKECRIIMMASEAGQGLQYYDAFAEQIIPWAKSYGCKRLLTYGRPGWEKIFDSSAKKLYTVFAKPLGD